MGHMKNLAIEEQERQALDSLYDAKYWEIQDIEYEMYLNSEQYFDDIEVQNEEDAFIDELCTDDVTITPSDVHDSTYVSKNDVIE